MSGMKTKTIRKIINAKINSWLKSIDDEQLVAEIRNSYIVTGGSIASMLLGEEVNDYDIYFSNVDVAEKVANHYLAKYKKTQEEKNRTVPTNIVVVKETSRVRIQVKSIGILEDGATSEEYQYFEMFPPDELESYLHNIEMRKENSKNKNSYSVEFISENAISLSDDVQIIIRFVGDAAEIHKNFDFVHATNYFTEKDGLVLNVDALTALMAKELRYVGSLYPVCSLFRIRKFLERGFTINAGEMFKISFDISRLDLSDPMVLEDQLTGVDIAYMHEIINILKADEKSGKDIDRTYVMSIIDKVFG